MQIEESASGMGDDRGDRREVLRIPAASTNSIKEQRMQTFQSNKFLQRVLLADAVVSGAAAVVQIAFADLLAGLFNLPVHLLMGTGLFLVGYVVLLIALARASRLWSGLIWLVIVGNVAWAVGCVGLVVIAELHPNALGIAFLAVQAVTVLAFAALEYLGLVKSEPFTRTALA